MVTLQGGGGYRVGGGLEVVMEEVSQPKGSRTEPDLLVRGSVVVLELPLERSRSASVKEKRMRADRSGVIQYVTSSSPCLKIGRQMLKLKGRSCHQFEVTDSFSLCQVL